MTGSMDCVGTLTDTAGTRHDGHDDGLRITCRVDCSLRGLLGGC